MAMKSLSRRSLFPFVLLALLLTLGLSACLGVSSEPSVQSTISVSNPNGLSPTPTAPAYLVGAYVSNSTLTSTSGTLTVYVIFHHGQLPQFGGQVSLYFHYENGGGIAGLNNEAGTQTTGVDGFASFFIHYRGLQANIPISVDVTVQYAGIQNIVEKDATSFSVVGFSG